MARHAPCRTMRCRTRPTLAGAGLALAALWPMLALSGSVLAQGADGAAQTMPALPTLSQTTPFEAMTTGLHAPSLAMMLALVVGLCVFLAMLLLGTAASLRRSKAREKTAGKSLSAIRQELDVARCLVDTAGDGLVLVEPDGGLQVLYCPADQSAMPTHAAELSLFDRWVEAGDAALLAEAIEQLRASGKAFTCDVRTLSGTLINVVGRPIGARLVVRLRDLSRLQRDFAEALHLTASLEAESQQLKKLLNALDFPIWTGDAAGLVSWSNSAFKSRGTAGQGAGQGIVLARSVLGEKSQWAQIEALHQDGQSLARVGASPDGEAAGGSPAVARDTLIHLRFADAGGTLRTAGLAMPQSEETRHRTSLARSDAAQGRMLNELSTAVCVFNAQRHLTFYNDAFANLFDFQRRVLDERPHEATVLNYLKSTRQMPESGQHRGWRDQFSAAYGAERPLVEDWELYDGRFLRVVTAPNADGGAIWLFENETEKVKLKSQFTALTQVRGATLDALREGVAVFGTDGRLQLVNPAFGELWGLSAEEVRIGVHARDITAPIRDLARDRRTIDQLVGLVGSLGQRREGFISRLTLTDDRVIDLVATPLPGGATMLTANDVSASVGIEDSLRESNAALEEAARIKTTFIKHVSYELRSPLTSIVGFAQLLDDPETGPLNERQRDYLNFVLSSTQSLVALVDSILDLATVDAGILSLSLDKVAPLALVEDAARGLEDRLLDSAITIQTRLDPGVPFLVVDKTRMRQVLYNLLSNAISFSAPGATVRVRTKRVLEGGREFAMVLVVDTGRGMSQAQARAAFEPFETGASVGGGRGPARGTGRGAGLGLTLSRALIELHGGTIDLWSREGLGTVVRCTLPLDPQGASQLDKAAE